VAECYIHENNVKLSVFIFRVILCDANKNSCQSKTGMLFKWTLKLLITPSTVLCALQVCGVYVWVYYSVWHSRGRNSPTPELRTGLRWTGRRCLLTESEGRRLGSRNAHITEFLLFRDRQNTTLNDHLCPVCLKYPQTMCCFTESIVSVCSGRFTLREICHGTKFAYCPHGSEAWNTESFLWSFFWGQTAHVYLCSRDQH